MMALADRGHVRERRNQLRHPAYAKPELLAQGPNELWSWDITKLLGPAKWTYYYLYVLMDVFSRYIVGWTVQYQESAQVAGLNGVELVIADEHQGLARAVRRFLPEATSSPSASRRSATTAS